MPGLRLPVLARIRKRPAQNGTSRRHDVYDVPETELQSNRSKASLVRIEKYSLSGALQTRQDALLRPSSHTRITITPMGCLVARLRREIVLQLRPFVESVDVLVEGLIALEQQCSVTRFTTCAISVAAVLLGYEPAASSAKNVIPTTK